jgi:hypothetical protein
MALLRPCTTSAGFMATPEHQRRVDMAALKDALAADGFEVLLDAKVILLVRKGVESSIYDTGKVLLKTTDKAEAESGYAALRGHLEAAWD